MKQFNYLLLSIMLLAVGSSYAQSPLSVGAKQLNAGLGFSGFGTPVYVGVDFGVQKNITVGPQISFRSYNDAAFNLNLITIAGTANYHFDTLLELPSEFNVYAGLTLGYYVWNTPNNYPGTLSSGLGLEGQLGGRYFFNPNWAVNLELGGGSASGGKVGVSYIF